MWNWAKRQRQTGGYDRWVSKTDVPLMVLALGFLISLVLPLIYSDLSPATQRSLTTSNVVIWAVFLADYLVRLYLAPGRARFVRSNVPDLIIILVPMLRPLRAVRLLRLLRFAGVSGRAVNAAGRTLHARVLTYVSVVGLIALFVAAASMLVIERADPSANIKTFPDALWWAVTTVSTVGYGDHFPVTGAGRLVATALMLVGIALLGVITAAVAAWFVQRLAASRDDVEAAMSSDTESILAAIAEVQERLVRLERSLEVADSDR